MKVLFLLIVLFTTSVLSVIAAESKKTHKFTRYPPMMVEEGRKFRGVQISKKFLNVKV